MLEILLYGKTYQLAAQSDQHAAPSGHLSSKRVWDGESALTLHLNGQPQQVLFLGFDPETRTLRMQVNGKQVAVVLTGTAERYAQRIGVSMAASRKLSELRAPMPGLVRAIHVQPGATVAKGDPLITLEAMKMENVLKAAADGTVSQVAVSPDAAVEKGTLLLAFE